MSFTPLRDARETIDADREGQDGGVGEDDDVPKPSLKVLQNWKKTILPVTACIRYGYTAHLKENGIVADVSQSVVSRCRAVVHALLVVEYLKKLGQLRQPRKNQGIQKFWKFIERSVHTILYGRPYLARPAKPQLSISEAVWALLYVGAVFTVFGLSLHSKINPWTVETHVYTTDGLPENIVGRVISCESYLQSAKNPDAKPTLNMCFKANKLQTVTVVMFSPMTKSFMDETIEEDPSKRPITKMLAGGLSVTQEAYDLIDLVNSTVPPPLAPLFPAGDQQDADYRSVKYVKNLMDYPDDYLRVSLIYDCNNCISCSLEVVKNLSRKVDSSNEASWVSCSYHGRHANNCTKENRYTGNCKLYPTETLSAIFAIRKFLKEFSKVGGIGNIRASRNARRKKIKFEPNILFLNISHTLSSSIMLSFIEVELGSPTWAMLLKSLPSVKKECTKLPKVQVCNGTSVCNMFRNADSYELRCLDFRNLSQCKRLLQPNVYIPDFENVEQTGEILCPRAFNCIEEAPYFVVWNTPERLEDDALNSFVGSRKLYKEWAMRSGVCTNTYMNVIRYHPSTGDGAGPSAKENVTMYLESKCTKETPTEPSHCVPTGRYHTLSDNPGAGWKGLADDLSLAITTRIQWSRDVRMGSWKWVLDAAQYVLGNTGSAILGAEILLYGTQLVRSCLGQLLKLKSN